MHQASNILPYKSRGKYAVEANSYSVRRVWSDVTYRLFFPIMQPIRKYFTNLILTKLYVWEVKFNRYALMYKSPLGMAAYINTGSAYEDIGAQRAQLSPKSDLFVDSTMRPIVFSSHLWTIKEGHACFWRIWLNLVFSKQIHQNASVTQPCRDAVVICCSTSIGVFCTLTITPMRLIKTKHSSGLETIE